MKTTDFNSKLTSSKLKENIEKQFGANVNLTKYSREQLEDIRNKLRTKIFQQEGTSKLNDLLTNETYQKDKAMLELLNTRIKEMLGEDIKKLRDKMTELSEAKKGIRAPKYTKKAAGAKPDFLDIDDDGNKKEKMKDAASDKKAGPQKGVNPFAKKDAKVKEGKAHPASCKCEQCSMTEEPNEGNAFGKAVRDAKADGVQKGEKVKVGGKEYSVKESFPTVAAAKKAHDEKGTAGMKTGDKQKSSTGGEITKTATGLKHTAGKNYGGQDAPKTPDSDKKAKKVKEDTDSKTDKLPSMSHIKKMCQDGKSVAEICKMHPNCDQSELKQMVADCKKKMVKESQFKHNVRFVNESLQFLLQEDEEGKAKAITAAGDMVNDYTSWMQRVGQYQTKTMIELADAIKADFGAQEAEAFKAAVGPALSATLEVLTQQREAVSNAVAVLAGEATPDMGMGMEPGAMDQAPLEPGMDMAAPDEMNPDMGDEFGAADAAAGDGTTGRAMRESRQQRIARKLAESHSIMAKLAR
jgi:hypothetical protein